LQLLQCYINNLNNRRYFPIKKKERLLHQTILSKTYSDLTDQMYNNYVIDLKKAIDENAFLMAT